MHPAQIIFAVASILYAGLCAVTAINQRSMIYLPAAMPGAQFERSLTESGASQSTLITAKGDAIVMFDLAGARSERPAILFFHGNSGDMASRLPLMKSFASEASHVYAVSYSGYPRSTGTPTQAALIDNAVALYGRAATSHGVVLVGESLGGGVAIQLALYMQQRGAPAKGIVLDSTFSSMLDMAERRMPYLPVSILLLDQWRSDLAVHDLTSPALFLHSMDDPVVAKQSGDLVFEAYQGQKNRVIPETPRPTHPLLISAYGLEETLTWIRNLR